MSEEIIWIFLLNTASSLVLTGIVWLVQITGYSSLLRVHREEFKRHHRHLTGRVLLLCLPFMVIEMASSIYLVMRAETLILYHLGGLLVVIGIWISSFLLHLPMQLRLSRGFNEELIRKLSDTNWLRVILWSAKSAISLQVLSELIS